MQALADALLPTQALAEALQLGAVAKDCTDGERSPFTDGERSPFTDGDLSPCTDGTRSLGCEQELTDGDLSAANDDLCTADTHSVSRKASADSETLGVIITVWSRDGSVPKLSR